MPEPTAPLTFTAESIVDTVREPMLVLDADLGCGGPTARSTAPSRSRRRRRWTGWCTTWATSSGTFPGSGSLLEEVLPQDTSFDDFEVAHDFPAIGRKVMLLNARRIYREDNHTELILLAIEDMTERRRLEDERRELETRFTSLVKNIRDHSIFMLDPQGRITTWNREAETDPRLHRGRGAWPALLDHLQPARTSRTGVPDQELRTALSEGRAEDERWHLRKGR